jgi:hypothetical protein
LTSRVQAIVIVLSLLVIGAGVALFLHLCERVEEEVHVGYRGPARTNPYLAAERLFGRLGAPGRTAQAGLPLPAAGHALFLLRRERTLSEEDLDRVLDWVEEGGRLIALQSEAPTVDPLLRHFGVTVRKAESDAKPKAEAPGRPKKPKPEKPDQVTKKEPGKKEPDAAELAELMEAELMDLPLYPGEGRARVVIPHSAPRLVPAAHGKGFRLFAQAGSEAGAVLLHYRLGEGEVTFLADAGFLQNDSIGRHDHARLAWHLATGGDEAPEGVQIVFRDDVPPLLKLLARHAWALLVSGAVLLGAWLWTRAGRFGPLLPDPSPDRRRLLEHVEAAGQYLWRAGRSAELIEGARQAVLARLERRQPAWARLPQRELAQRLGTAANLPPHRVDEALRGSSASDPAELVTLIQTLEKLRRSL